MLGFEIEIVPRLRSGTLDEDEDEVDPDMNREKMKMKLKLKLKLKNILQGDVLSLPKYVADNGGLLVGL